MPRLDDKGEILLVSGDIVRYVFQIVGGNQKIIDEAIHCLKQGISHDDRFNYQGSEIIWVQDEGGFDFQCLAIYVQVAKGKEVPKSSMSVSMGIAPVIVAAIIIVSLATATALVTSSISSWQHNLTIRGSLTTINGILASDLSPQQKATAIGGVQEVMAAESKKPGFMESLTSASSTLAIAAVVIVVLWAVVQLKPARSA